MTSKVFCPAPFVHFYNKGTPAGKICCIAKHQLIQKTSAKETWENSRLSVVRESILQDKPVSDCEPCYNEEENGGTSDRQYYLKRYLKDDTAFNVKTGNKFNKPIDLDLRLSNLCNLGCRMCGPHYSSTLEKDLRKLPELEDLDSFTGDVKQNSMLTDDDINWLIRDNPDLRRIKFLGGEPTLMPEVYKILDILIQHQRQPTIGITTNCTNLNERFKKYISYFKNTTINMSIDGTGRTVEYIRHPVNFETVKRNIKELCTLSKSSHINFVIQALNIHNLCDFIDFVVSMPEGLEDVNSVICNFPKGTSPYYLPVEYRKPLLEKALNHKDIDNSRFKKVFKPQLEQVYNSTQELPIQEFLFRNMLFDQLRNTHLYNIMPDIRKHLIWKIGEIGISSRKKPRFIEHYVDER